MALPRSSHDSSGGNAAASANPAGSTPHILVGLGFILCYALPLFVPPPARGVVPPAADASLIARLFPDVPAWWVLGRLIALLIGATLIASVTQQPLIHLEGLAIAGTAPGWRRPWVRPVALFAAALHLASLPWLSELPPLGQTLFMVWFAIPAGLLAWGLAPRVTPARLGRRETRRTWAAVGAIVTGWVVYRLVVSWHSPRAADVVDMWRIFGGFVRLTAAKANFLIESMDPKLPGENAMQLFFQGLPLLQMTAHAPSLAWMQVVNAVWLAVCAAAIATLCATLMGWSVAVIATAAFLFSPFSLLLLLGPVPGIALLLPALLALLVVAIQRSGSPAAIALFGSVAGLSMTLPSIAPMTGLALVSVAWTCRRNARVPAIVMATAACSLVAGLASGVPSADAMREMVKQYAAPHFPWAVAERALQGQLSPVIDDWTAGAPGWLVIPTGVLLSPFAISRSALRLWGDVLFEPFSAGLSAVGLAVCVRHAVRDRASLTLLVWLAAALLPGLVSSYDKPSLFRILGAPIPLAVLAAVGFGGIQTAIRSPAAQRWGALVAAGAIAVSGTVIFDVVNPRILSASSIGLLVRAVAEADLSRVALLTVEGMPPKIDMDLRRRHWEFDWLRSHHPYVDTIITSVPRHPVSVIPVDPPERLRAFDVVFWSPALEQTRGITDHLCSAWPDAALYTITDEAGLSLLYGARPAGPGWKPSVPKTQWSVLRCGQRR